MATYNLCPFPRPGLGDAVWSTERNSAPFPSLTYGSSALSCTATFTSTGSYQSAGFNGGPEPGPGLIPVPTGVPLYISFDHTIGSTSGGVEYWWGINFFDADAELISSHGAISVSSSGRRTRTGAPPAGTAFIKFFVFASMNAASSRSVTFSIDRIRVSTQNSTTALDGTSYGYGWSGTELRSTTIDESDSVIANWWRQPRTTGSLTTAWVPYWEASGQTSGGMTVTSGPGARSVSGNISRTNSSTYRDVGLSQTLLVGQMSGSTAYLSATVSSVSGLGTGDAIRLLIAWFDGNMVNLGSSSSITMPTAGGRSGGAVTVPANVVYARVALQILTQTGFTSASHAVSATIDYIRLTSATETDYLDGSTPGYTWRGAANSAFTISTSPLQSTGQTGFTGTLETRLETYLVASGGIGFNGSLISFLSSTSSTGHTSFSGALDVWPYGPVSAEAGASFSGTIELAALLPVEMSGGIGFSGTVETDIAIMSETIIGGVGFTGTLEMSLPPDMEMSGDIGFGGTLESSIAGQTSSRGEMSFTGTLDVVQLIPAGSFADFAIFATTETDPLRSITSGSNGGINSGATGAEWTRVYGEFAAPQGNKQWGRAAFAIPGIQFSGVAAGDWQEFTYVQLEISGPSGPSAFSNGASLRPLVYPDRLNVHPHAVTVAADPAADYAGTPITSPLDGDTTGGLNVEVLAGNTLTISTALDWLIPGTMYTASMYLKPSGTITDILLAAYTSVSGVPISQESAWSDAVQVEDLDEGWRRIHVKFAAPETGTAVLVLTPVAPDQVADESFDVAGMLVESGINLNPYFWPDGPGPDIGYRNGFSDATGGIFYYNDRLRRAYILKEALEDQRPTGIGIEEAEFFTIPHIDV
ncbi:hypothetical protein FDA94_29150 [Herbidospora galbida]|uniref:Uncharacterized protein n=1 Tax=Herbidospora galbida TaxID=2575442 RepID=A0A4V5UYS6_9ACTN|nr:hypothetical protein [Herbidospora galbida]TKK84683.1 hypothetical protein FDA94_29150 [Herbidospora galbida]